ncbi:tannase/feruloyl esterase family alpha/beta hydrolase [Xanthomonas floridensis]|uniref:Tannase n=1 Tax=Xanthomonas floridensis TaxID=1843580 RepID=A0A1A9M7H4_9XANT|nr:tannase/feruloyl esterase family alpha/beta hydrolase [Xanthomonas floridensis]MEA5124054.1 tannase/feruloyl esterase family alpha/beta hydrolase [Xanthomonas floridensis]MEA5131740.1 tannase/feruloyl esterase family alpha/beta hydrolase [Xanthomonas floridensis]OAG65520.1 tannase [Xanthomonas floridensis]
MFSPSNANRRSNTFYAHRAAAVVALFGCGLQGCARTHEASIAAVTATGPQAQSTALAVVKPVMACADLGRFDLSAIAGAGSKITAAVETTNQAGQSICAVEGTLLPAIDFAVQLPMQTWTQRYLQIGCGGLCGSIAGNVGAADGCAPLNSGGFVLASTDMGHQDQDGTFGKDARKRADFAYRGQHLTAVAAKALIRAYYGRSQRYAYFSGCSDGGREGLIEAQRYPNDFDGIIAGAGALNFVVQNAVFHAWQARANTGADGKPVLLAARLPVLHAAVLKACDALDGLADGVIGNPLACHFDPATLQCPAAASERSACLSAAEIAVVRKFYDGPRDQATGTRLSPGGPQYGSELAWAGVYVPQSANDAIFSEKVSLPVLRNMAFEVDPPSDFTLADMQFDLATFQKLRVRHRLFDATNPDLSAFADSGGKLILFHGWSDPHISPINSIAYYTAMREHLRPRRADSFARLYAFPGMYHCSNGEGPYQMDLLTPLMAWVERGTAPDAIQARQPQLDAASDFGAPRGAGGMHAARTAPAPGAQAAALGPDKRTTAQTVRARPVYPWPSTTAWDGKGDPGKASSFVRGPAIDFQMPAWAGAEFFSPYAPLAQ